MVHEILASETPNGRAVVIYTHRGRMQTTNVMMQQAIFFAKYFVAY